MSDSEMKKRQKAIIVGGSISGVSCAHALTLAGWDVVVIEKSPAPPTGSPTGAGLGLDPLSRHVINSWIKHPHLLQNTTLPLTIDQNQATGKTINRDEELNFRAAYWADLHHLLYNALPGNIFLWGHVFLSFHVSSDKKSVKVNAKKLNSEDAIEIFGDLLVAADGCLSSIRRSFVPNSKPRYAGYCAWRGVLDFSEDESSKKIVEALREAYPHLGKCLYFDLGHKTHAVLYELPNEKLNWVWYVNQPEPELKGNSVTMKASDEAVEKMRREAEKTWSPSLAGAMEETREPFVNVIFDCDPLERLVWEGVVVLVGDAAHPTTPHGLRSTNMSLLDAAVLGACLRKQGLDRSLREYESLRLPVVAQQVLHSRRMGQIKQGLLLHEDCEELKQNSMPFFGDVPAILDFNPSF